LNNCC